MIPHELVKELSKRDIKLWLDGEQLRVRAPKGALTAELRESMAEHKAGLLAMLRQQETASEHASKPLVPVPRGTNLPLSFAQQRLWVFDRLNPGSAAYNIPANVRLSGRISFEILERSISEIVRRHEALRTSFSSVEEQPVQMIAPEFELSLPMTDLRDFPEDGQETELQRLALAEFQKPFDLSQCPLFRIRVVRMAEDDCVVLMTVHHIIFDEWSAGLFIQELAELYEAFSTGNPSPLSELPIQYADFSAWQRDWLQGNVLDQQLSYWKRKFSDELPNVELPTDRPRAAQKNVHQGRSLAFALSETLSESLKALSKQEGCTLFMTMFAAFNVLLSRYTGQDDTIVGTPVANRSRSELEGLIGFFVNTLALRSDLSENPSFRTLLARVRQTTIESYAHQDLPFDLLVDELRPERQAGQNPLFQVMFVLQNAPMRKLEISGLSIRPFYIEDSESLFDLSVLIEEQGQSFKGEFVYNCELFDRATIQRMSEHFQRILEAAVEDPDRPISELPLLSDAERHQLLVEWNDTQAEFSSEQCLHQLFEAQVERTPDKTAVIFQEQELSYRNLDARANQLARYLRTLGVQPETLVGIMMERSLDMIVGLLAILKAGGGYLPLAHDYPEERLTVILSDAQVSILLTQQHLLARLPVNNAETVCMDADWDTIDQESAEGLDTVTSPENIACLLYTSGSTGTPKGAVLPHRALVSFTESAIALYGFTDADRILQYSSVSFDALIEELFPCLSCGGSIVIRTDDQIWTYVPEFLKKCEELKLTILDLSTAYWHLITSELLLEHLQVPESLRLVIIGGDRAIPEKAEIWRKHVGDSVTLMNTYGPTETTVVVSAYELPASAQEAEVSILPIGRPLRNVQLYVLDRELQPVPVGVAGELHVGGEQLARGYLNRPDLTEEKFIPNPFSDDPNARLYKTGDLVRYLPDGNVEFLGRVDQQVKVRGFRIEPGEVEAVLSSAPGIRETAVIAREDIPGEKRLVAYVVPVQEETAGTLVADSRSFLQEKLPNYMIPEVFVILESLPRTATGKLHRRALPAPDKSRAELADAFVAPRSPIEQSLAAIWQDVLNVERVGIHDNFFELGGNSLLVTRLMSRVRDAFQAELPLATIFEVATIKDFAEFIEGYLAETPRSERSEQRENFRIPPVSREEKIPLSFEQERLWFLAQMPGMEAAHNMSAVLRLSGPLQVDALERSFSEILCRHEVFRTSFSLQDGQAVQVLRPPEAVSLTMQDLQQLSSSDQAAEVQRLVSEEAETPFNFQEDRFLRLSLLRLTPQEHILCLTTHHIIFDGWSISLFNDELMTCYNAFREGNTPVLPELTVQYADYAYWQRGWLQKETLAPELSYWKEHLSGAPQLLELPGDRERPESRTFAGASYDIALPGSLFGPLQQLSAHEHVTLFMTLMAAFSTLVSRSSRQNDFLIGSPVSGRISPELESLIGFFAYPVILRADMSGDPTFRDIMKRTREETLRMNAHQHLPFAKMIEVMQPERSPRYHPLIQVMFDVQEQPLSDPDDLELQGLTVSPVDKTSQELTEFDLFMSLYPSEEGISGVVRYSTELFEAGTIAALLASYQNILEQAVRFPDRRLSEFELSQALEAKIEAAAMLQQEQTIAIVATFTAEPVKDSLDFWMQELEMPSQIRFAPYNQVFQQLLDPAGLLAMNAHGVNILLLRFEDWQKETREQIERNVTGMLNALKQAAAQSNTPYLLCLCPASPDAAVDAELSAFFQRLEEFIVSELQAVSGAYVVTTAELQALYPVADYYDARANQLGHVPYTPQFFTALGTMLARRVYALQTPPYKVIALDCDGTLWEGVCGEDGADGVEISASYRALQEFMLQQREAGMLLCLCSKNSEEDVFAVFDRRRDEMPLKKEHFTAMRINWQPKSHNIVSLANELNLGLDSVIFVDDNPIECAEVEANCPDVFALELPEDAEQFFSFLRHIWVFDHLKVTDEDRKRSERYQQNTEREHAQEAALIFEDFLRDLDLKIDISPMQPAQLPRVSQLTKRTNQFNLSTIRRSESEIQQLCDTQGYECLVCEVSDRFGEYGLVGALLFKAETGTLAVDTFLLSCRALGRGVEYAMLRKLGALALERGLDSVKVLYRQTERNQPALDFLETSGREFKEQDGDDTIFRLPANIAAEREFHPV